MSLTYGSMCSGYGGLEMGVQSVLGGKTLWHVEFDTAPSKILAHRFPGVPNYGDLTTTDWHSVPRVDVITAGFPCQPFSHAGKRLGANDERHLWPYIQQAVAILRPRLVVLENVRGLLSGQGEPDTPDIADLADDVARLKRIERLIRIKQGKAARRGQEARKARLRTDAVRIMGQLKRAVAALRRARAGLVRAIGAVTGGLADVGYDAWWIGLRAADVGAAHGRFRIFVFAQPSDADLSGLEGRQLRGERAGERATGAGGVAPVEHVPGQLTLLPTPAVNDMGSAYTPETWDAWTERMKSAHGNGNGHGKSLAIEAQRLLPTPVTAYTASTAEEWRARRPAGNGATRDAIGDLRIIAEETHRQDWREYEAAIRRQEAAFGRPAPLPTETGPKGNPRLSPRFVEWLMALPEGHVTDVPGISRNDMLKALGNGVVPPQAAAATRAFLADSTAEAVAS